MNEIKLLPVVPMRDILKQKVGETTRIKRDPITIYLHHCRSLICSYIAQDEVRAAYQNEEERTLALEDLHACLGLDSMRVTLETAAVAWLSADEFRWPPEVPSDLSYGIVTQYFSPLIHIGAYLAGINRRRYVSKERQVTTMIEARRKTIEMFNGEISESEIVKLITDLHLGHPVSS